jgi:hypothetical protein
MDKSNNNDAVMMEYLLGDPDPEELARIEESILTDDVFFEELSALEDELVERYIDGDLSQQERGQFEQHFLATPALRTDVNFARALKRCRAEHDRATAADRSPALPPERVSPRFGLARNRVFALAVAAGLLLVISAGWWLIKRGAYRDNPDRHIYAALTLEPGALRSNGGTIGKITIPANTDTVQLRLDLRGPTYDDYQAAVRTDEGALLFTSNRLQIDPLSGPPAVVVSVPAKLLIRGDYQVQLSGGARNGPLEDIDTYYFRSLR